MFASKATAQDETIISIRPEQSQELYCKAPTSTTSLNSSNALSDAEIAKLPLTVTADEAQINGTEHIELQGNIDMRQGPRTIQAQAISVDKTTNKLELRGEVAVQQPGVDFRGTQAKFDSVSGEVDIHNAEYRIEPGARGSSERIQRNKDKKIILKNGSYTSCPENDNTWLIKASKLTLDPEKGYGSAKHARLHIKDIPVFYFPYFAFPIGDERKTGFLWPNLSSSNGEVDASIPYYLNLAPNYDLTLTPRYLGERGTQLATEARYLNRYSHWTFSTAYLDDDSSKTAVKKRWLVGLKEYGQLSKHWRTKMTYLAVSDINYFRDLGSTGLDVRNSTLVSRDASLYYQSEHWFLHTQVESYQLLTPDQTTPYTTLPRISLNYTPDRYQLLQPLLFTQFTHFEDKSLPTGQRLYLEPGIQLNWQQEAGFIRPAIKFKHLQYALSSGFPAANHETSSWQFGIDSGLFFERYLDSGGIQTLEPRLKYLLTEKHNQDDFPVFDSRQLDFSYQQLFRETRISGYDRITDANQISMSIGSRWMDQTGSEWASARIGQQFYFSDRNVNLATPLVADLYSRKQSNIVAEFELNPSPYLSTVQMYNFNPHNGNLDQAYLRAQWHNQRWDLLNFGYRYRRLPQNDIPIEQLELSSAWTLSRKFSAYAAWRYDMSGHHSIEKVVALEYNNCCWRIRLAYQDELESFEQTGILNNNSLQYENTVFLQLELKGLGNVSNQVNSLLNESILGFKQREKYTQ